MSAVPTTFTARHAMGRTVQGIAMVASNGFSAAPVIDCLIAFLMTDCFRI